MVKIYVAVYDSGFDDTEVIGAYPTRRAAIEGIADAISKSNDKTDIDIWNDYIDELIKLADKGEVAPTFSEWLNEYMEDIDDIEDYCVYDTYLHL